MMTPVEHEICKQLEVTTQQAQSLHWWQIMFHTPHYWKVRQSLEDALKVYSNNVANGKIRFEHGLEVIIAAIYAKIELYFLR